MTPAFFESTSAFRSWLARHHAKTRELLVGFYKRHSAKSGITYHEALDQALCFGWIDGQSDSFDDHSWIQRYTPRRPRGNWSKRNTEHAERLIKEKRMKIPGLAQVKTAKKDGRWKAAYDSPGKSTIPEDFLKELGKNKKAKTFFDTLNKVNLYSITYRLQTAKKPETREKRMTLILGMMAKGEKFHP